MAEAKLICPKCGSDRVLVQAVTETKTKHRAALAGSFGFYLLFAQLGCLLSSHCSPTAKQNPKRIQKRFAKIAETVGRFNKTKF